MISIDLIFLCVLINAVIGTVYMKIWAWHSKRLEKRAEYAKIYQELRMAILFFVLPGIFSVLIGGRFWKYGYTSWFGIQPAWRIMIAALFVLALAWLSGAVWHTYKYILEVRKFCEICGFNTEVENEQVREYFTQICERRHIYKGVTVYVNPELRVPVIFGVFKRTILLPAACSTPEELQIILEHEMIHAKHNDLLLERIAAFIHLIIWFAPETKKLLDEMEDWSETICDFSVCKSEDSVWSEKQYFSMLIQWAQEIRVAEAGTALALSGETSGIRTRIMRVRRYEKAESLAVRRCAVPRMLFVVTSICIVMCVSFCIHRAGQAAAVQISTQHLLSYAGIGNKWWNNDIQTRGSEIVAVRKESKRMIYLAQGEHIRIYYEAGEYGITGSDIAETGAYVFGEIGVQSVSGDEEMQIPTPVYVGQGSVDFIAKDKGWYYLTIGNTYGDETVKVDYIVVKQ